jgi:hypothetical protein
VALFVFLFGGIGALMFLVPALLGKPFGKWYKILGGTFLVLAALAAINGFTQANRIHQAQQEQQLNNVIQEECAAGKLSNDPTSFNPPYNPLCPSP